MFFCIRPLVVEIENFLTGEEATHIISRAAPHMKKSGVALKDADRDKVREFVWEFVWDFVWELVWEFVWADSSVSQITSRASPHMKKPGVALKGADRDKAKRLCGRHFCLGVRLG